MFEHPCPLKFEVSLYGTINIYLMTYFPLSCCFIMKPQATLCPVASTIDSYRPAQIEVDNTVSWDELEQSQPASPAFVNKDEEENKEDKNKEEGHKDEGNKEEEQNKNSNNEEKRDIEQESNDLDNISMDAGNSYVQHTKQGVENIGISNFIVIKATGALDGDYIVLAIKVKKH